MKTFGFLLTVVLALAGCLSKTSQSDRFKCDPSSGTDCPDAGDSSDGGEERSVTVNAGLYGPSKAPGRKTWVVLGAGRAVHQMPSSGELTVSTRDHEDLTIALQESDGRAQIITVVGFGGESFSFPPAADAQRPTTKRMTATANVSGRTKESSVSVGSTYSGGQTEVGTAPTLLYVDAPTDVQTVDVYAQGKDDGGTIVSFALAQNVGDGQTANLELQPLNDSDYVRVENVSDYPGVKVYEELATGDSYNFNRRVFRSSDVIAEKSSASSVISRPSSAGLSRMLRAVATDCSIDGVPCAYSQKALASNEQTSFVSLPLLSAFHLMTPSLDPKSVARYPINEAVVQWKTPTAGQWIVVNFASSANPQFTWTFLVDPSVGVARPFALPSPLPKMAPGTYLFGFFAYWYDTFKSFDELLLSPFPGWSGAEEREVHTEGKVEFY